MKKLLLLLIPAISWGAPCAGANGYTYCQTLVVDHTKVAGTLSNYPAAICFGVGMGSNCLVNSKQLATAANGGFLQDSTHGYDFIFTSDSGGTMPYTYETSIHNLVTGDTEIWIKIPTTSSTVDLTVYMFYGNASVTTDQSNATGVWDANYLAVHHFQLQGGSTYNVANPLTDSTGVRPMTVNDVSSFRPDVPAITGVVGGGANYNGVGRAFVFVGPYTNFPPTGAPGPFTLELWVNLNGTTDQGEAYCFGSNTTDGDRFGIYWYNTGSSWIIESRNHGASFPGATSGWHRIAAAMPSGSSDLSAVKVYVDGALQTVTGSGAVAPLYSGLSYESGVLCGTSNNEYYKGLEDEMRLSITERSATWILTDYNNQSNVAAFWSNSRTTVGVTAGRTIIIN